MEKVCRKCKEKKPLDQFNRNKAQRDGLQTSCRGCDNKRAKNYYQANREKLIVQINERALQRIFELRCRVLQYLSTHPCVDCGNDDLVTLEFDHVRGKKEDSVKRMVNDGVSWHLIEKEIAKCEVRCANCHRIRTAKTQNWLALHPELWQDVNFSFNPRVLEGDLHEIDSEM